MRIHFLERNGELSGVISVDSLPEDPHLLVCNTDPSDRPDRHWIAIYVNNGDFFN